MEGLFDAHCHLDPKAGPKPPRPDAPAAAGRLLCGVNAADWDRIRVVAAAWPGTIPAYGIHPWHAAAATGDWPDRLEELLTADADAWLGEAGLDGLRIGASPFPEQEDVFRRQLRLAKRLGRRVNLHCVKAWPRLLELLDADYLSGSGGPGCIVHAFAGPHQFVAPLRDRGALFTVGPLLSRSGSSRHRQRCRLLPEDRLLLESDAFLSPGRDAADELLHALGWLAEARERRVEELAEAIGRNGRRVFHHV